MGDDDLRVTFCAQSSTFEEGFFIPNALLIDVLPGLNIVNSIDDKVEIVPEIIVEEFFTIASNSHLDRLKTCMMINLPSNFTSYLTFIFSNMLFPEQELSVQVTDLDVVIICAHDSSVSCGTYTHQRKHLDELASQGSCSDQKGI